MYRQLLDRVMASKPEEVLSDLDDAPRMSQLYESLATLYRRTGDIGKARDIEGRRSELWHQWDQKLPNNAFVRRQLAAASVQ
jgi:hypothetical protein